MEDADENIIFTYRDAENGNFGHTRTLCIESGDAKQKRLLLSGIQNVLCGLFEAEKRDVPSKEHL